MMDDLGLGKIEKDLNRSLSFEIFQKEKQQKKQSKRFPKPKPHYTKQKDYSRDIQQAKKFAKETGSAFNGLINNLKNRKIRKLEKQAMKAKAKADKMAHEIKTKTALIDYNNDIKRYDAELKKINEEYESQQKGTDTQ